MLDNMEEDLYYVYRYYELKIHNYGNNKKENVAQELVRLLPIIINMCKKENHKYDVLRYFIEELNPNYL